MADKDDIQLEKEADQYFAKTISLLADTIDLRCFAYGKLRYVDTKLLKKSVHLVMTHQSIDSLKALAKEIDVSSGTINRMIQTADNVSVNRASIDKLIDYMKNIANETQE